MASYDRFDALIINEDSSNRGRLKQAAMALTSFRSVFTVPSFKEGMQRLSCSEPTDIVLLSYKFGQDRIVEFIEEAKDTNHGADAAYIIILNTRDQSSEKVANSVLGGVHGCLFEPYSAENLREIAEIAAKVKKENMAKRERAAAQILMTEIIKHIDALGFYRKAGKNTRYVMKKLEQACAALKKLDGESMVVYHEVAFEMFKKAKLVGAMAYTGVSDRVRRNVEAKMAKEMEAEYGG